MQKVAFYTVSLFVSDRLLKVDERQSHFLSELTYPILGNTDVSYYLSFL